MAIGLIPHYSVVFPIEGLTADQKLITELDKLDLPDEIHKRDRKLIKYCDLRMASYELIYKSIAENTNSYNDQIRNYTDSIKSLIKTLK